MDFEMLDRLAADLMVKRKAHLERELGSVYYHGKRTARLVLALRERVLPGDAQYDESLRLAAMFHDLGKGIEPHARYGAALFREAVRDLLPAEQVAQAARLIESHCDRRPDEPAHDLPARLLQDADLLDHLGVYEIWMNFNYNAHHGLSMEDALAYYQEHLEPFIARHRKMLNFPQSVRVYDDKCAFIRAFVRRMEVEARGEIYGTAD